MTPDEFIKAIRNVVLEASVISTLVLLRSPPGRRPSPSLVQASKWFNGLSQEEQTTLEEIIRLTAHQAVFGMLAVLDGVRTVEDSPEKGTFRLLFQKGGQEWEINSVNAAPLHDILNQG